MMVAEENALLALKILNLKIYNLKFIFHFSLSQLRASIMISYFNVNPCYNLDLRFVTLFSNVSWNKM